MTMRNTNTKQKILTEAVKLFATQGFEAVTVEMIADAVGIKAPSLYKHYLSKHDIFDHILTEMEHRDAENAADFLLPTETKENSPAAYGNISVSTFIDYCEKQFRYWTENEFAASFRKMLTIEQYRNEKMNRLYHQYLGYGPLKYTTDLLGSQEKALSLYGAMHLLYGIYDNADNKNTISIMLISYLQKWLSGEKDKENNIERKKEMNYPLSKKYDTPELMSKIMGPNPLKLAEELLIGNKIPKNGIVCDLGSGQGLTSVFLAKEYGFRVYAADLWSNPDDNRRFFKEMGLNDEQIVPVKADASSLPFEKELFDAVVTVDSYNYFGRDTKYLDDKLLPFVKKGGYIYIAVPGMKKDCHDNLPPELLLSWTPEQLAYIRDVQYWTNMISQAKNAQILSITEMASNAEVWADWLKQDNEYAIGDRKAIEAGGGKYLNFIKIVLQKI